MTHGLYHKILRVSIVVTSLVLLFDGGFITPITKSLSQNTYVYLGNAVGIFAGVEPNELNVITAELTERTRNLDVREQQIREREIATRDFNSSRNDYSIYILSVILFALTCLILVNYALDWRRARRVFA